MTDSTLPPVSVEEAYGHVDGGSLSDRDARSDERHTAYLIYPSSHPDEGEMLVVNGRSGIVHALATSMVFGEASVEALSPDHRAELDALMEQFDDADEWCGSMFSWSFEDGGIHVVRLAPEVFTCLAVMSSRAALTKATTP